METLSFAGWQKKSMSVLTGHGSGVDEGLQRQKGYLETSMTDINKNVQELCPLMLSKNGNSSD